MDIVSGQMAHIPSLRSSDANQTTDSSQGIHAIALNPSKTLLATGAFNTKDVAIYKLPTLDPACVGEVRHNGFKNSTVGLYLYLFQCLTIMEL